MPAISPGPANAPSPRRMTNRSLIGTIIAFHLCALPFAVIAIKQIRLHPGGLLSYIALLPVFFLLGSAYTEYLDELLRRRRASKHAAKGSS
jgi:hypothetical protein